MTQRESIPDISTGDSAEVKSDSRPVAVLFDSQNMAGAALVHDGVLQSSSTRSRQGEVVFHLFFTRSPDLVLPWCVFPSEMIRERCSGLP